MEALLDTLIGKDRWVWNAEKFAVLFGGSEPVSFDRRGLKSGSHRPTLEGPNVAYVEMVGYFEPVIHAESVFAFTDLEEEDEEDEIA